MTNSRKSKSNLQGKNKKSNESNLSNDRLDRTIKTNFKQVFSPLNYTSAKFRMLVNSEPHLSKYQCVIDDNLPAGKYSYWDIIIQYQNIAYDGINKSRLVLLIWTKTKFLQWYYRTEYSLIRNLKLNINFDSTRSFLHFTLFNWKSNSQISIDQIVLWFPKFIENSINSNKIAAIENEQESFKNYIITNIDKLLEEYYMIVDTFPHELLLETTKLLLQTAEELSLQSLKLYQNLINICWICGEGFDNKENFNQHFKRKDCQKLVHHQCQCMKIFNNHLEWTNHWLKSDMSCPTIAWHLWRNISWKYLQFTSYCCDGCHHHYAGFLEFWNHICYCPFFRVYLISNCQICDSQQKDILFYTHDFQELIKTPYSDKVGIKILQEWAKFTTINFRVKLLLPDENNLLEDIHILKENIA